ncbi:MFS transporter [Telmatospirillum sp.]|uniref:MFS transporter n=1 Tax=Telmatospirillum sp. TaxID=2079197 RepID=UPI00284D8C74|nr:MFS transporter [Telmatospirillum sp.]MDR3440462.1 MFS transporter [Telmatospirillum sp.]
MSVEVLTSDSVVQPENYVDRKKLITVVGSSLIGTAVEFYDFFIYGTAAAIVFPRLFFPNLSPLAGLLAAYATLAITFVSRPIGAVVFGHYGDKLGRKKSLVLALMIMGLSTFFIGLLPTYETIGVWAPIGVIVLRLAQGFAVGGEWGGAASMIVEYAPRHRRGFFGTFVQLGNVIGLFLSTLAFALVPSESMMTWGWRLPFLLSIVLLFVGLFIRARIDETPAFLEMKKTGNKEAVVPLVEVMRSGKRAVFTAMGARTGEIILGWLICGFLISYATNNVGFSRDTVLHAILAASAVAFFTFLGYGALSDRIGRRPVYLLGACIAAAFAFPLFWLIDTGSVWLFFGAVVFGYSFGLGAMFSVQPSFFSELFDTNVRYTGISLGYQLANIIGGLTPMIATALVAASGGKSWPVSTFLISGCIVTILCVLSTRESAGKDIVRQS